MIVDHGWRRGTDRGTTCGTVDSTQWSRTVTAKSGGWPRARSVPGSTTAPIAEYLLVRGDVCDQVRALRSSCSARRQRPPGLAGPASDDDLPLPLVDVARLGVLRVVADRGQPRAGCPVAARWRPGGRPGLGPSPRG